MANVSSVETVVLVHKGGKGLEEMKGNEITVPLSSVRVWAKTGWEPKGAEAKKRVEAVEKGAAPATTASASASS